MFSTLIAKFSSTLFYRERKIKKITQLQMRKSHKPIKALALHEFAYSLPPFVHQLTTSNPLFIEIFNHFLFLQKIWKATLNFSRIDYSLTSHYFIFMNHAKRDVD